MSKENELPENVIKGPWKKRKTNQLDEKVIAEHISRTNADEFTMSVMEQMVKMMSEHGVDIDEAPPQSQFFLGGVDDASFIRDAAITFELVQAAVYRDIEFSHPMHKFVEEFVSIALHEDNAIETEIDFDSINALVELLEGARDDPEIS